jgi:hypothetical protein
MQDWVLILDNDRTFLRWCGENPFPEDSDAYEDYFAQKDHEGQALYAGGSGYHDLAEAMRAAGIPAEWV